MPRTHTRTPLAFSARKGANRCLRNAAASVLAVFLLTFCIPESAFSSSFGPTVLVNTEGFQVLDDSDTAADLKLRFGDTIAEELFWNRGAARFEFTDDLHAQGNITASGSLIVEKLAGTSTGNTLVVDNKGLVYDATNKRVGIGTTAPGYQLHNVGTTYLGDTVTDGAGTISWTSGFGDGTTHMFTSNDGIDFRVDVGGAPSDAFFIKSDGKVGIGTTAPINALEVKGAISGTVLHARDGITSSGTLKINSGVTMNIDATAADVALVFGSAGTNESLAWVDAPDRFEFSDDLHATGNITASGNLVINTASRIKAGLQVAGVLSGATLNVMSGANSYVLGNFGVGTSTPSSLFNVHGGAVGDAMVNVSDSDVAHGITDQLPTNTWLQFKPTSSTLGGAQVTAATESDGNPLVVRGFFGSTNPTDTVPAVKLVGAKLNTTDVQDLGAAETVLQIANNDNAAAFTVVGNGRIGVGPVNPETALEVVGTVSGSTLTFMSGANAYVLSNFGIGTTTPRTKLDVNGVISGAKLSIPGTVTFRNVAYTFPQYDGTATGKVLKTDGAGNLSWSADSTGGGGLSFGDILGTFVNQGGDTMTGALTVKRVSGTYQNLFTVSGGRIVVQTTAPNNDVDLVHVSGGSLRVSGNVNATGTILSVGNISTRGDLTLNTDQTAADTVLTFGSDTTNETLKFLNTADRFEFSDDLRATGDIVTAGIFSGAKLNVMSGANAYVLSNFGIGTTTPRTKLDVNGVISGAKLSVPGTVTFRNVAYTFPQFDGTATGKVLKTNGAGTLSWSDDSTGAGGGISYADAKSYFVDDTGDTMTGALTVKRVSGGSAQNLLTVSGGTVVVKNQVPTNALDILNVSGGSLKVSGNVSASGTLKVGSTVKLGTPGVTYTFPPSDGTTSGKVLKTNGAGKLSWSSVQSGATMDVWAASGVSCGAATTFMGFDSVSCNATEATADTTLRLRSNIIVTGLRCMQFTDTTCTINFRVRKNAANAAGTPNCASINGTACSSNTGTVMFTNGDSIDVGTIDNGATCTDTVPAWCNVIYTW